MSVTLMREPHENPRIDPLTDAQRLRWVLAFIRRDLDALPSEVLEALGDDLQHATAPWWVDKNQNKKKRCTDMLAEQVRALQREIRDGIHAVMSESIDMTEMTLIGFGHTSPNGGWVLPKAVPHLLRVRFDRAGRYVRIMRFSESTDDRMAILTGVANLLIEFGDRLRTCEVCGTPFLRQYRQEYCTVRCSNKIRNRRRLDRKTKQRVVGQFVTTSN